MSGHFDHKAEAEAVLGEIRAGMSADVVAAAVAGAQVHATLALVEKQHTANLIAYVQLLEMQYAEAALRPEGFDWSGHADSMARHAVALVEIRKGLGL